MKHEPERIGRRPSAVGNAYGGHETGAVAVRDQLLVAPDHWRRRGCLTGCRCLASGRRYRSQRQATGERGAALEEFPSALSFRTHRSLLENGATRRYFARSKVYVRIAGATSAD